MSLRIVIINPFDSLPWEGKRPHRYSGLSAELVRRDHQVIWLSADFHHRSKRYRSPSSSQSNTDVQVRLIHVPPYSKNISLRRLVSHRVYARGVAKALRALQSAAPIDVVVTSLPPTGSARVAMEFCADKGPLGLVDVLDAWPLVLEVVFPQQGRTLLSAVLLGPMRREAKIVSELASGLIAVSPEYLRYIAGFRTMETEIPKPVRRFTSSAFWVLERFACLFFDAIVAATDDIASNFHHYGQKVVVVKNYPLTVEMPRRQRPLGAEGQAVLIYIGTLTTATGIPQMVKALAHVKRKFDVHFNLLGRFAGDGCREQVEASDPADQVSYLGWLGQTEVVEHLCNADVGMACLQPVPQYVTSEPNKLFEYMRCGLPIVASDFPLWREIIEGEDCGVVVDPRDPPAIGQAVSRLLADPPRMRAMGENGRRAVQETYNWDSQRAKLLQTHAGLMDRAGGGQTTSDDEHGA